MRRVFLGIECGTQSTQAVLRVWMTERAGQSDQPLFPTRTGRRLSTDAVQRLVRQHAVTAALRCPSIRPDKLHPHILRHSCAMTLLHAGVDTAVIALWLGHADIRSTNAYLHADLALKHDHPARTLPPRRPAAGLPGKPVTMPATTPRPPRSPPLASAFASRRTSLGIVPGSA